EAAFDGLTVRQPLRADPAAEIAICPSQRGAMVYVLDGERREQLVAKVIDSAAGIPGVDLVIARTGDEAVVRSPRGELRFAPGGELADLRGGRWSVDGERAALGAHEVGGRLVSQDYPDAFGRIWAALECDTAGDVLLSAAPGYEFVDWGGQ